MSLRFAAARAGADAARALTFHGHAVAPPRIRADVLDVLSRSRARLHRSASLGDGFSVALWSNSFDATRDWPGHHTFSLYLHGGHGTYREDAPCERG